VLIKVPSGTLPAVIDEASMRANACNKKELLTKPTLHYL
jgi:hypothetical protein